MILTLPEPPVIKLGWRQQYRIIASTCPPINFFEDLVDPEQMEALWHLESLTNDRLLAETGNINLVAAEDRVCGAGSTPVMAAFTHIGRPSRFTNGSYGVYYASKTLETAIYETVYQKHAFLTATEEKAGDIDMRVYVGRVTKPLHDLRANAYHSLYHPEQYAKPQSFADTYRSQKNGWGFVYYSVRHPGGENIAALRPPAVSIPSQGPHLAYRWNGQKITEVYEKSAPLIKF